MGPKGATRIGAAGAVAAGAYGILGGAARQVLELMGTLGRIGDDQIPKQARVQDEAPPAPFSVSGLAATGVLCVSLMPPGKPPEPAVARHSVHKGAEVRRNAQQSCTVRWQPINSVCCKGVPELLPQHSPNGAPDGYRETAPKNSRTAELTISGRSRCTL